MKFENLENKRFGMLTVLELAPKTKNRSTLWLCQCNCGNKTVARNKNLLEGITTDCGCISKKGLKEGQKVARLTLIKEIPADRGRSWQCVCDCGKELKVREFHIRNGIIKSCGCLKTEYAKIGNKVHGYNKTRLQRIHFAMKKRCYLKTHIYYKDYGGRGITVCDEWLGENGLENFAEWALKNGYRENLTIDRIDNNKGYYPNNCRWATRSEQQNNRRISKKYEYNGESFTVAQLSRKYSINYSTLHGRLQKGMNVKEAIETNIKDNMRRNNKKEGGN